MSRMAQEMRMRKGLWMAMRQYFPMRIFVIVGPELFTVVAKIKVMAEFLTSCFPYWDIGWRRGDKVFLCRSIKYFSVTIKSISLSLWRVFPYDRIKYFTVTVREFLCHNTIYSVSTEESFWLQWLPCKVQNSNFPPLFLNFCRYNQVQTRRVAI